MTMSIPSDTSLWRPMDLASPATRRLLRRYVARRVPACDVDDVVQATLCDAVASARAPSEAVDLQRWLLSIARFKVADAHRAASRSPLAEVSDVPAPALPIEALSLACWAERQLPPGDVARRTLQWMMREAEGDKLEAIAADERLPATRVRQRISRLRRWMRERWVAELAAVAALGLLAVVAGRSLAGRDEIILPDIVAGPSADEARLRGAWRLVAYEPAQPLSAAREALWGQLGSSLVVTFDGRYARAAAGDGSFEREYGVVLSSGGHFELVDAKDQRTALAIAWEGDVLVITVASGPWAGEARFQAAGR